MLSISFPPFIFSFLFGFQRGWLCRRPQLLWVCKHYDSVEPRRHCFRAVLHILGSQFLSASLFHAVPCMCVNMHRHVCLCIYVFSCVYECLHVCRCKDVWRGCRKPSLLLGTISFFLPLCQCLLWDVLIVTSLASQLPLRTPWTLSSEASFTCGPPSWWHMWVLWISTLALTHAQQVLSPLSL